VFQYAGARHLRICRPAFVSIHVTVQIAEVLTQTLFALNHATPFGRHDLLADLIG
jgi:hypothetical protein